MEGRSDALRDYNSTWKQQQKKINSEINKNLEINPHYLNFSIII